MQPFCPKPKDSFHSILLQGRSLEFQKQKKKKMKKFLRLLLWWLINVAILFKIYLLTLDYFTFLIRIPRETGQMEVLSYAQNQPVLSLWRHLGILCLWSFQNQQWIQESEVHQFQMSRCYSAKSLVIMILLWIFYELFKWQVFVADLTPIFETERQHLWSSCYREFTTVKEMLEVCQGRWILWLFRYALSHLCTSSSPVFITHTNMIMLCWPCYWYRNWW